MLARYPASHLPDKVDALIAGAGPAGLAAAHKLMKSGATVLLVDARRRIGAPLRCAELTNKRIFKSFEIEPRPDWVRWELPERKMIVLNRPKFEWDVSRLLGKGGVIVSEGTGVIGVGPFDGSGREIRLVSGKREKSVRAGIVIAADGISSSVAKYAGINTTLALNEVATCLAFRVVGADLKDPKKLVFDFAKELSPFYFWIIPSGPGEANIGLGLLGARGFVVRRILKEFMKNREEFSGGKIAETIAGNVPSTRPMEKPYSDGLLVTGAAARLVRAADGEGIRQAVISGKAAAETIIALQDEAPLAEKLSAYRKKIDGLYRSLEESWKLRKRRERRKR